MEIECVKYKEWMSSESAVCRHPGDYCKFRSSCIIHFLGSEKRKEGTTPAGAEGDQRIEKDQHDDPA
jgi:hypothetical protein